MRILALPGAAIGVIAIPFVIAAAQREAEAPTPDPRAAALTVRLVGAEGDREPAYVYLTGSGEPPAVGTRFRLVDETGLETADGRVVRAVPTSGPRPPGGPCHGAPLRRTGLEGAAETEPWCLEVTSVDVGSELKGTVTGRPIGKDTPATKLALTVTRRNEFKGFPLAVVIIGLILGALTAILPQRVRGFVKRIVLAQLLNDNRTAGPGQRIDGLEAWVSDRLKSGLSAAAVISLVTGVVKDGPQAALEARQSLRSAIDASGLPVAHPFVIGATLQANMLTHDVSEFIDSDGNAKPHPATEWKQGIARLVQIAEVLEQHRATIDNELNPHCRAEPEEKLRQAWVTANAVKKPIELAWLEPRVTDLRKSIEDALGTEGCKTARALGDGQPDVATLQEAPDSPDPLVTSGKWLGAATFWGVVATAILLLLTLLFAGATIYSAAYENKPTFGDWWSDYFPLLSAALGSGAAASALAILAYWQREGPPDEA